jgi:hypothetical protein
LFKVLKDAILEEHRNCIERFVSVDGAAFHPFRELLLAVVASRVKKLSSAKFKNLNTCKYYSIGAKDETDSGKEFVKITNVTIAINNIMLRHFQF